MQKCTQFYTYDTGEAGKSEKENLRISWFFLRIMHLLNY